MKKTLILAASLLGAVGAYAQGTIVMDDAQSDVTIHIFAPQTATPGTEVTGDQGSATPGTVTGGVTTDIYYNNGVNGNYAGGATAQTGTTSSATTGGSTVYTGGAIGNTFTGNPTAAGTYNYNNGSDYSVELFAAAGFNAPATSLQPITQYLTTIATASAKGGLFKNINVSSDPGIANTTGNQATLALVAWYNGAGTYTSYAAALSAGVPTGMSPTFNDGALGGLGSGTLSTPNDLQGAESFSLVVPVPEPSTIALGVIGASTDRKSVV